MGVPYKEKYGQSIGVSGGGYTKAELRSLLPEIGDRRVENAAGSDVIQLTGKKPGLCTVVGVNEDHFWYRVRFDATGACKCFKLPKIG